MRHPTILRAALTAAALLAAIPGWAQRPPTSSGQTYPDRPIRFIVPYPPGGATDIVARGLAQKWGEAFGQQVVIDNRGGAGQILGTELGARAAPDGYTLLLISITHSINPALVPKLPYDSLRDFTPISLLALSPQIFVAHPGVPAKNVPEFVAYTKAKAGQVNYASSGNGSGGHLASELFKFMTGASMTHIPYKGAAPALVDVVAGQTQVMFTSPLAALPQVKAGRLRALGMAGAKRSPAAPDIPTVAEQGVPGYEASLWYGLTGPAGLPKPIVTTLHAETVKALAQADFRERLLSQTVEPLGTTPEELRAFVVSETAKWGKLVRTANIRSE
jgi:tripartite-type tricarboxylate transporter receptor subunit TctC